MFIETVTSACCISFVGSVSFDDTCFTRFRGNHGTERRTDGYGSPPPCPCANESDAERYDDNHDDNDDDNDDDDDDDDDGDSRVDFERGSTTE